MNDQDGLTELRGAESLRRTLNEYVKAGDNVALAWLDIDSFDDINHSLGTEAGDRVIAVAAKLIQEFGTERKGEAYRVGGDAFALLLPGLTLEQAFLQMERLRAEVQAAREKFALSDGREITISIGVAQYPRDGKDASDLIKAADAAMLNAKEQGQNAVGLPPNEEMVLKSCYYPAGAVRKLRSLAEKTGRKESVLLREALADYLQRKT